MTKRVKRRVGVFLCGEVLFEFCGGAAFVVGEVADDAAVLQEGNACRDVDGVLQVVAGDDDGGTGLLGVFAQQVLQQHLTGGVEEVEGFVEDDDLGVADEGGDDADLHLVTGREVADELLLSEELAA